MNLVEIFNSWTVFMLLFLIAIGLLLHADVRLRKKR